MATHLSKAFLSDREYFDARFGVVESGCWEWKAYVNADGYGEIRRAKGTPKRYAHRLAYELYNGQVPEGMHVCHECDNPTCVNPKHLFLGTHVDNMKDKVNKGRVPSGSKHGNAKLNEEQVMGILTDPRSQVAIARSYGIDQSHVCRIKNREVWASLKEVA